MLYCNFYKKLRTLNPNLKVYGDDSSPDRPWGIYLNTRQNGLQHICGVNPIGGMVYERTERRWDGYILRQGWRRVLKILIQKGFVPKKQAEKLFSTTFNGTRGKGLHIEDDPLTRAMKEARARGYARTGVENYVEVDDLIDIHRWREQLRQNKQNYWA